MSHATYIGKNLTEPVIYNAVADRIALLRRPQETVEFYMRIAEAKSNLEVMRVRRASRTPAQQEMDNVQPDNAQVVADSLVTALQLARSIIADPDAQRPLDQMVQTIALQRIDSAMESAQQMFPDAESFQAPQAGGA